MGEVIRKDAAGSDIAADGKNAVVNASAKGGRWKELADERLAAAVGLLNKVTVESQQTEDVLVPLEAAIKVMDVQADDYLGATADAMWNKIGRPAFDAAYSLIWPGGYRAYADGSDEEQPDRMDLLADLLEANLHPGIDAAWATATADDVRARAKAYRGVLEAARVPRAKAKLFVKMKAVLARGVQMELARLKRRYLAEGFTEAEIHQVIPDRPKAKAEKGKAAPAKGAKEASVKEAPVTEAPAKEDPAK